MTGSASCSPAHLAATRAGWHRVAEHVLAAALYAATGEITLVPSPGGFRTPPWGADGRFLAVDGAQLVVGGAGGTRRAALTTIRAAADFAGVTPGAPTSVYAPVTPLSLDEPLVIERDAARLLADWYYIGGLAMSRFTAEIAADEPSPAWLWPEHFDLGITAGAINYGASPGDDRFTDPYMYVGPHDGPPPGEPAFWNAPFGAVRTFRQIGTAEEAATFFRDGRGRVRAHAAASPTRRAAS
jgi:hypothetical protein